MDNKSEEQEVIALAKAHYAERGETLDVQYTNSYGFDGQLPSCVWILFCINHGKKCERCSKKQHRTVKHDIPQIACFLRVGGGFILLQEKHASKLTEELELSPLASEFLDMMMKKMWEEWQTPEA